MIIGGKIAPIFFNTAEDSGALPIECDVSDLNTGDLITIRPYDGTIERDGAVISRFELKPSTISDEVRAGGRIPLMIGRALTDKVRSQLGLSPLKRSSGLALLPTRAKASPWLKRWWAKPAVFQAFVPAPAVNR